MKIRDTPGRDHLSHGESLAPAAEGIGEDHGLDEARLVLQRHELHGLVVLGWDELFGHHQGPEAALVADWLAGDNKRDSRTVVAAVRA